MNETLDRIMEIISPIPEDYAALVRKALELAYKEGQLAEKVEHLRRPEALRK